MLHYRYVTPIHIGAASQDDLRSLAWKRPLAISRIGKGIIRELQGDEVLGLSAFHLAWHHTEIHGTEMHEVIHEAASARIHAIRGSISPSPVAGSLGNRIHFVDDVLPESTEIGRLRENA